jgi:hypothetical protein
VTPPPLPPPPVAPDVAVAPPPPVAPAPVAAPPLPVLTLLVLVLVLVLAPLVVSPSSELHAACAATITTKPTKNLDEPIISVSYFLCLDPCLWGSYSPLKAQPP